MRGRLWACLTVWTAGQWSYIEGSLPDNSFEIVASVDDDANEPEQTVLGGEVLRMYAGQPYYVKFVLARAGS
jgi:hypothetical protein